MEGLKGPKGKASNGSQLKTTVNDLGSFMGMSAMKQMSCVMLYGAECWAMCKKEDDLLRRTEMRMLRRILGVSMKDKIRNEEIRKRCEVVDIIEKVREARLRWYGHIGRKDAAEPVRSIMEMEIKGNRGQLKKRWMDCINEDLTVKKLTMDMVRDRKKWRIRIRAANPGTVWD